jgi:hypothetical protein
MPRYFFHTIHAGKAAPDEIGVDFAGPTEARTAAVKATGEAILDLGAGFWIAGEWQMLVTEESGATLCSLKVFGS